MVFLHSIEPIQKVFQTSGSYPVLVTCSDRQKYVCKYVRYAPAEKLFLEYLISNFAKLWKLQIPDYKFVKIKPEHIPDKIASEYLKTKQVVQPVFGVLYLQYARDIDSYFATIENNLGFLSTIQNPFDILKISLFDLWLSNEDRHHNNYNLILNPKEDGNYFYVIDHEKCFNSNALKYDICHITFDESLLNTEVCNLIFQNQSTSAVQNYIQELEKEYYICVEQCRQSLSMILEQLPKNWGIDLKTQINLIQANIFTKEWIDTTFNCFREYLSEVMKIDKDKL